METYAHSSPGCGAIHKPSFKLHCNLCNHSNLNVLNHSVTSKELNKADYIHKEGRMLKD
jgi:hypothetical protein